MSKPASKRAKSIDEKRPTLTDAHAHQFERVRKRDRQTQKNDSDSDEILLCLSNLPWMFCRDGCLFVHANTKASTQTAKHERCVCTRCLTRTQMHGRHTQAMSCPDTHSLSMNASVVNFTSTEKTKQHLQYVFNTICISYVSEYTFESGSIQFWIWLYWIWFRRDFVRCIESSL